MPTPSKPAEVLRMEKKAHYSKKELASRKYSEESALTGIPIVESPNVAANEKAHAQFESVKEMLALIGRDDNIYGNSINRYCLMIAEVDDLLSDEERIRGWMDSPDCDMDTFTTLQGSMNKIQSQVNTKEKMLLDLEKESLLTVASALRSVPKQQETKKSPLMEALASGN